MRQWLRMTSGQILLPLSCENIRFSSLFAAKSEEERMFSQANFRLVIPEMLCFRWQHFRYCEIVCRRLHFPFHSKMTNETIIRILNWPKLPSIRPRNEVFRAPLKTSDKKELAPLGYDSNPDFPQGPCFYFYVNTLFHCQFLVWLWNAAICLHNQLRLLFTWGNWG